MSNMEEQIFPLIMVDITGVLVLPFGHWVLLLGGNCGVRLALFGRVLCGVCVFLSPFCPNTA